MHHQTRSDNRNFTNSIQEYMAPDFYVLPIVVMQGMHKQTAWLDGRFFKLGNLAHLFSLGKLKNTRQAKIYIFTNTRQNHNWT